MYARVWKFNIFPERVEQYAAGCRAVLALNRKRAGFRGLVVSRGGPRDAPESTVVSVWDSLENLRASESDAFQKAVARVMACCKSGAVLREEEILVWEFAVPKKKKKVHARRRAS